jgi:pimeloyl-ACP methyl ester carboxylesterase
MWMDVIDHAQRAHLWARGFRSRQVMTSVGRVHAIEAEGWGTAPPLVVQHGIGAAGCHFHLVLPALRRIFRRIVAPDLPGHGFSDVPSGGLDAHTALAGLTEALDQLVAEPSLFFGNSLGGLAVVRYAQQRPGKVRALLLNSPAGAPSSDQDLRDFLGRFDFADHHAALTFVDRIHSAPPWYRRLIASGVSQRFKSPWMRAFVAGVRSEHMLRSDELTALPMPVQLLWGRTDRLMPEAHRRFYESHLPQGSKIETPDDFGHCPYLDRPARLIRHIADFASNVENG